MIKDEEVEEYRCINKVKEALKFISPEEKIILLLKHQHCYSIKELKSSF